jgi:hypothetical protein
VRDVFKVGLKDKTLEAEKLKFQLAGLERVTFGTSPERIEPETEPGT